MSDFHYVFLFAILICAGVALVTILIVNIHKFRNKKLTRIVSETSPALQKRLEIYNEYNKKDFYEFPGELNHTFFLKRRNDVMNFQFDKKLINLLLENDYIIKKFDVRDLVNQAMHNNELFVKYDNELELIPPQLQKDEFNVKKVSYKRYHKRESILLSKNLRPNYNDTFILCVTAYYISPQGKSNCARHKFYSYSDLQDIFTQIQSEKASREEANYQRKLVTPSIRYDVLTRDHYHCVLCGRGPEDGVKLQVDHIIPVSKGGKTIMSNLRTLCQDCNLGKSNKSEIEK